MSRRAATWLAWSLCAACVVLVGLDLLLDVITEDAYPFLPHERPDSRFAAFTGILSLAYPTVGALVVSRLPSNPIGWIFCAIGLLQNAQQLLVAYADYALLQNFSMPRGEYVAWFSNWAGFGVYVLMVILLLLFPHGRLPSRRWRIVAWASVCGAALSALGIALTPGSLYSHIFLVNPLGVVSVIGGGITSYEVFPALTCLGHALMLSCTLAALLSTILRLRRSRGDERRQLKWFMFAAVPAAFGVGLILLEHLVAVFTYTFMFRMVHVLVESEVFAVVQYVAVSALLLVPVFTYVAILRYRLYDIDHVINRTLVYGSLSACIVGIYVLAVGGLGVLFQARGDFGVSLLATGVVAVVFQPLRGRLQRGVNRLMYGERDDPYAVLSRLGRRLEATIAPDAVLPTVVETIAQELKLPYAAILLKEGETFVTAAAHGSPAGETEDLPLVYGSEEIGRLVLAPRAPGEGFSDADRRLLEDLARQAEVAVHAVRLTADLQRSREKLVAAREEERRRLRRDLHDGLGAQLAGLNVQAGTLRRLIPRDPVAADELVVELRDELRVAISDIRRLVYDLRPPALDDLGLVETLRRLAERYGTNGDRLRVSVEADERPTRLPAAVEVAIYRVTQEALTNVARHARARICYVRLAVNHDGLELEIEDDGGGIPEGRRSGVGLASMRERAAELGGTCEIGAAPAGGTRVSVRLPLTED